MLINYARGVIYTTAPSFIVLAGIRAGYNLLKADFTVKVSEIVLNSVLDAGDEKNGENRSLTKTTVRTATRACSISRQALLQDNHCASSL